MAEDSKGVNEPAIDGAAAREDPSEAAAVPAEGARNSLETIEEEQEAAEGDGDDIIGPEIPKPRKRRVGPPLPYTFKPSRDAGAEASRLTLNQSRFVCHLV